MHNFKNSYWINQIDASLNPSTPAWPPPDSPRFPLHPFGNFGYQRGLLRRICGDMMKNIGLIGECDWELIWAIIGIPMGQNTQRTMAESPQWPRGLMDSSFLQHGPIRWRIVVNRVRLRLPYIRYWAYLSYCRYYYGPENRAGQWASCNDRESWLLQSPTARSIPWTSLSVVRSVVTVGTCGKPDYWGIIKSPIEPQSPSVIAVARPSTWVVSRPYNSSDKLSMRE